MSAPAPGENRPAPWGLHHKIWTHPPKNKPQNAFFCPIRAILKEKGIKIPLGLSKAL